VYIAAFAKELKLDSISFQKLRLERFSPLKEVVESTPGYHYDSVGGPVYSDRHSLKDLKRIRNRIRAGFYGPAQAGRILRKIHRARMLSAGDVLQILTRLPTVLYGLVRREMQKRRPLPAH